MKRGAEKKNIVIQVTKPIWRGERDERGRGKRER